MNRRNLAAILLAAVCLLTWQERAALAQAGGSLLGYVATSPLHVRISVGSASLDPRQIQGQNSARPIYCDSTAKLNMTSATTTEIVAISGSTTIFVCSYAFHVGGANNLKLVRGTGSNCGTGTTDVGVTWKFGAADAGINRVGTNIVAKGAASGALCVTTSTTAAADIEIEYAQF